MKKFEEENRYFAKHPTPKNMRTELKDYQQQALQWMKIREGHYPESELFEKNYKEKMQD